MKNKIFKTKLLTVLLTLCPVLSLVSITAFAADPTVIDRVDFTYEEPKYNAGDSPQKLARIIADGAHYTIYDEYIAEMKDKPGETNVVIPTGYEWHSNPIAMSHVASDKRITSMEAGKMYIYRVVLQPEGSQYKFDGNTTEVYVDNRNWGTPAGGVNLGVVDSGFRIEYTQIPAPYASASLCS